MDYGGHFSPIRGCISSSVDSLAICNVGDRSVPLSWINMVPPESRSNLSFHLSFLYSFLKYSNSVMRLFSGYQKTLAEQCCTMATFEVIQSMFFLMWQPEELPMKEGQGQNTVTWIWSEYEHYEMVPWKKMCAWMVESMLVVPFLEAVYFWKHALVG